MDVEVQKELQKVFNSLRVNNFQVGFQKWQERWHWCIATQENYFEEYDNKAQINKLFFLLNK